MAGVSISTASRAINGQGDVSEEKRQKVLQYAQEYHVAPKSESKHRVRGGLLGLVIIGNSLPFFITIIEQIQTAVARDGFATIIEFLQEDQDELECAARLCHVYKLSGLVFIGGNADRFQQSFASSGIHVPCVLCASSARWLSLPGLSSVGVDEHNAARMAVDYLIGKGHRQIALLGGDFEYSYLSRQRYRGYMDSLGAHGISVCEDLLELCDFTPEGAYAAMQRLLQRKIKFTAVFCMSDQIAIAVYKAVEQFGLSIPEDLSVIGYNGLLLSKYLSPALTTIKHPVQEISRLTAQLIVSMVQDGAYISHHLLESEVSEGGSVREIKIRTYGV